MQTMIAKIARILENYFDGGIVFDGSEKLFQIRTRFFFLVLTTIVIGIALSIPFNIMNGETISSGILFLADLISIAILILVRGNRNRINMGIRIFGIFFPLLQGGIFLIYPNLNEVTIWAPLGSILVFFLLGSRIGAIVTSSIIMLVAVIYNFTGNYILISPLIFGEQVRAWIIISLIVFFIIRKLEKDDILIRSQTEALRRDNKELQKLKNTLEQWNDRLTLEVEKQVYKAREQERTIFRQARLASLGEMLQAIAHQWRQPLNATSIILQDLDDARDNGELTSEYFNNSIDTALQQIHHMSRTIDVFLDSTRSEKEKHSFFPRRVVDGVFSIVSAQMKHNSISLKYEPQSADVDSIELFGFRHDLEHALANVIINAKDAIVRNASETGNTGDEGWIRVTSRLENNLYILKVEDSGGGILEKDLEKVFDPYFTTRPDGTGIGLFMAKTMLKNGLDGEIDVENGPGGAIFTFRIPVEVPQNRKKIESIIY